MDTVWRWLHLIAASFWLGGLIMLAIVTISAARAVDRTIFRALIRRVGRAFLAWSLVAWAVLALTGVAMAATRLHKPADLTTIGYGRTLVLKSSLFILVIIATVGHTVAAGRTSTSALRFSRVLSPVILLLTLAIFFLAARLASA